MCEGKRYDSEYAVSKLLLTAAAFVGGQRCACEDPTCQKTQSPFPGLHSNWITPQVCLHMARYAYFDCNQGSLTVPLVQCRC